MVCDTELMVVVEKLEGLNPTFSGMWSATGSKPVINVIKKCVLILLFLECGLRHIKVFLPLSEEEVLILLFLECGLRRA